MEANVLREKFLSYFSDLGHEVVASSAVVPKTDPTLLFANAGMNQFKDVFLGNEVRSYKRAASAQKCIRAGGKHNDLDEVGKDGRHLTFFEMLGNWSFGDYGKSEAIRWAWDFLTVVLGLPAAQLYVSIYRDDDEAFEVWHREIGLAADRIVRFGDVARGDEENFWSMGPVGACGPCTEIYIDLRPDLPCVWGPGYPEDRYLELWNNVFMQFNRSEDGKLTRLPMCSVDTGMGLERIAAVMQHVDSVYETDLFSHILEETARLLGRPMRSAEILSSSDVTAYRVIADHIRTLTFAVSEGQPFSNDGRGYVLRRILRRAVRFGRLLGFDKPFLYQVSQAVVDTFEGAYPEIALVAKQTQEVIRIEEERFYATLDRGIARFEEAAARAQGGVMDGEGAFTLYDTYGFPLDLTQIMAEERGLTVDVAGFEAALMAQRQRSSEKAKFYVAVSAPWVILHEGESSEFAGYEALCLSSEVLRYRYADDVCEIIFRKTPFYAEGGGEVGDRGVIVSGDGALTFNVLDTIRGDGGIVHVCEVREGFVTPEVMAGAFELMVDSEFRSAVSANHTCTHLLQAALREVVGEDVYQAGSLVRPERLRLDYTFPRSLTCEELSRVESRINEIILRGVSVRTHADVPIDEAKAMGAMAIFGEKYGASVRVVEVEGVSVELCGGIHVENTRDIQLFRIVSESAIAAGVRRIEAVTRRGATGMYAQERKLLEEICQTIHVDSKELILNRLSKILEARAQLEKEVEAYAHKAALASIAGILQTRRDSAKGVAVYASLLDVGDRKEFLRYGDLLRDRMGHGVAMLGALIDGKPALTCIVSESAVKAGYHAGQLVSACAEMIGGKGGGRPHAAQAGGVDASKLDEAIARIYAIVG